MLFAMVSGLEEYFDRIVFNELTHLRIMKKEIFVLIEHDEDGIAEAALEVIGEAVRLSGFSESLVSALVLGNDIKELSMDLERYGADKVYIADHPLLAHYSTDGYCKVLEDFLKHRNASVLLMAATALGKDLAPRLAARLQCGLTSDCAVLKHQGNGALEMTRPIYGGRVYAAFTGPETGMQIVTIRPGILGVDPSPVGRTSETIRMKVMLEPEMIRTMYAGFRRIEKEKLDISEADVVFAVGKGLGKGSYLPEVKKTAKIMNASLAGSRAAVDEGWISFVRQIGQTGKTISPGFILCCGISGAQQFTMGMRESKFIVAINTDRNAPIFNIADVSVLGDMNEIIPLLAERLKKELQHSEENS
ncbi:MAG: electron transfer flavoprotein subunit alpha/FixB family protein [Desulfobacterales bacterium]